VTVSVTKAAPVAPTARSLAAAPWTTTVRYEGAPLRIVGPRLSRGDHIARITFKPDPGPFLGCKDTVRFRVGAQSDVGGEEEGGGNLPDTGGPHLLLLLVGAGLVAAGAGLVGGGRRVGGSPRLAGRHSSHA
jgi:LPXTG-motif cell wall-anchored protein